MKSPKSLPHLNAVSLAFMLALAPLVQAQRSTRTEAARPPASTTQRPAAPSAQSQNPKPPAAQSPTTKPSPAPEPRVEEKEDFEADRAFGELVPAEGYSFVLEFRRIGQLMRSKEAKELLELFRFATADTKELTEALDFFTANAEALNDVTTYTLAMPTRADLPDFVGAYEFSSIDAARAFEPRTRTIIDKYQKSLDEERARREAAAKQTTSPTSSAVTPSPSPAPAPSPVQTGPPVPQEKETKLVVRRYGRVILMTAEEFTLKSLRSEGEPGLSENSRFQSLRSRLTSEPVFLYFDLELMSRSTQLMRETLEQQTQTTMPPPPDVISEAEREEMEREMRREVERMEAERQREAEQRAQEPAPTTGASPTPSPSEKSTVIDPSTGQPVTVEGEDAATMAVAPGSEMLTSLIFGGFLGGGTQWPDAVALALALEGESIIARALVVSETGAHVQPIPFIPTIISGPLYTPQAATVAPADTEVFISASLDLAQIYRRVILQIDESNRGLAAEVYDNEGKVVAVNPVKEETEKAIEAAEKLMGFKIKEDFIPALGNEVALCVPLKWFMGDFRYNEGRSAAAGQKKGGGEPVILVSLNNAEAVKKMLPRILELAGLKALTAPEKTTTHAGVEIKTYGPLTAGYVGSFLALSWDAESVKRIAEGMSARGPLASDERFRSATSWEPRPKLGEAYVSRALVEKLLKDFTRWADPKDPEIQQVLARLNVKPEPATYAVTSEGGDRLLHELRLPSVLLKLFAASAALDRKIAPLRQGEDSALATISHIRNVQEDYRKGQGNGSYAALEQLAPERKPRPSFRSGDQKVEGTNEDYELMHHPLSKTALEKLGYHVRLSVAGDKYTVVATPKEYGRTGRRSFYMDETGIIRGADRGGEPATADDPPID